MKQGKWPAHNFIIAIHHDFFHTNMQRLCYCLSPWKMFWILSDINAIFSIFWAMTTNTNFAGSRSDCVNWKIVIDALSRHHERRQIAENVKSFNEFRIWFDSFRNLILLWSIEDDSDELMQTLYWWSINSSPNFDADEAIYCPHPQFCWFALHKK